MTRDEVLALKPGRELDALVAEYVVGMKEHRKAYPESFDERVIWFRNPPNVTAYYVPFYSTDISAAWEVVEKMSEQWPQYQLAKIEDGWSVMWGFDGYGWPEATGKTAPEAICKAALLAVMDIE